MVEFLATRWGCFPWQLDEVPIFILRPWFKVAVDNAKDEGSLLVAGALLAFFNR